MGQPEREHNHQNNQELVETMETEAFWLWTLKGSQLENYTGFLGISILADNYWQGLVPRDRHRNQNSLTHEQVQRATTTVFKSGQNYFMPVPWGICYLFFHLSYRRGLSMAFMPGLEFDSTGSRRPNKESTWQRHVWATAAGHEDWVW